MGDGNKNIFQAFSFVCLIKRTQKFTIVQCCQLIKFERKQKRVLNSREIRMFWSSFSVKFYWRVATRVAVVLLLK